MEKFLFTDGINGVKEAASRKELEEMASGIPDKANCRVWIFGQNEWLGYTAFITNHPVAKKLLVKDPPNNPVPEVPPSKKISWKKRMLSYAALAVVVFLVYNFTRLQWAKPVPVQVAATRPANVPYMDVDSLIGEIELTRGERIDRNTKSNLRLRNTWPEAILLHATANRSENNNLQRFSDIIIHVDNTTGHTIDQAIVMLNSWNNGRVQSTDTLHFNNIGYNRNSDRSIPHKISADSISVAFHSIQARSFNFCYSISRDNPSGNYNDRWFCRSNQ